MLFQAAGTRRSLIKHRRFASLIVCRGVDSRDVPIEAEAVWRSLRPGDPLWGYRRCLLRRFFGRGSLYGCGVKTPEWASDTEVQRCAILAGDGRSLVPIVIRNIVGEYLLS